MGADGSDVGCEQLVTLDDAEEGEGFAGYLSRRQSAALQQLRARLAPRLDHPRFTDVLLLRFLRARRFDVDSCAEMVERHLEYRARLGLDEPTEGCWYGPGPAEAIFPEMPALKRFYPHGFHKVDREGRPVYIERLGQLDIASLLQAVPTERIMEYFAHESERQTTLRLPACSLAAGRLVQSTVTILDLDGLGFRTLSNSEALGTVRSIIAEQGGNFPEITGKMLIVNAPAAFSMVFGALKPMLSRSSLERLEVFRSGHEERLRELICPEDLPEFLGGTCRCQEGCLSRDVGPWCHPEISQELAQRPHWEVLRRFEGGGGPALPEAAAAPTVDVASGPWRPGCTSCAPVAAQARGSHHDAGVASPGSGAGDALRAAAARACLEAALSPSACARGLDDFSVGLRFPRTADAIAAAAATVMLPDGLCPEECFADEDRDESRWLGLCQFADEPRPDAPGDCQPRVAAAPQDIAREPEPEPRLVDVASAWCREALASVQARPGSSPAEDSQEHQLGREAPARVSPLQSALVPSSGHFLYGSALGGSGCTDDLLFAEDPIGRTDFATARAGARASGAEGAVDVLFLEAGKVLRPIISCGGRREGS